MPTTDLTPGTITTLGALRPGDVARYVINDDKPELTFVVGAGSGWGVYVAHYPGRPALDHYGEKDSPVRYLGRCRIEPARIVMDGESDPTIEQTVRRVLAAAVSDGIVTYDRDPTRLTAGELVGAANVLNDAMGELLRRIAELETQVRQLRAALQLESASLSSSIHCGEMYEPFGPSCSHYQCHAVHRIRKALAAIAPKEKP